MDKERIWRVLKTPFKIAVTGMLLYLVFQKIDIREVQKVYQQSTPAYFLLAILSFLGSQVFSASRFRGFLMAKGLPLPFFYNLKLHFLVMFYNLFLPGGVGGDGYRLYLLRSKFKVSGRMLLSTIFIDRLSGLWAMVLIAGTLMLFIPEIPVPSVALALAFLAGTVAYFFLLRKLFCLKLAITAKGHTKAFAVQLLQVICVLFVLQALNAEGRLSPYLLTFLASSLVAVFPFTIGGLGAREYVFILATTVLPMERSIAVTISLSFYLLSALVALSGIYFVFRSKEFGPIPSEKKRIASKRNDVKAEPKNIKQV